MFNFDSNDDVGGVCCALNEWENAVKIWGIGNEWFGIKVNNLIGINGGNC